MSNAEPRPAPEFLDPETALARIEALTTTARNTWLLLIGFLAFIGTTLLSVRDVDFFSVDATTQLPIIDIAIPTTTFFWTASLLAAILHTYFHVFLLKLWDALAEAPPDIGASKLGDRVFPWLVNDWALRRRADRPVTGRPLDLLGSVVTSVLIWLATPILLTGFWWRSAPAHDAPLSLAIALALGFSLIVSLRVWRRARKRLGMPGIRALSMPRCRKGILARIGIVVRGLGETLLWIIMAASLYVLIFLTLDSTGAHRLPAIVEEWMFDIDTSPEDPFFLPAVAAYLVGAEISIRPDNWRDPEIARRRFRIDWCRDQGLPAHGCDMPRHGDQEAARQRWCDEFGIADCAARFREIDAAFEAEWHSEREAYLSTIIAPDLSGRDLRNAYAIGAFLVRVDLIEARIERADLRGARLEWANLSGARLEGADLSYARLERALLNDANLENANLVGARLEDSHLDEARLQGAVLASARLDRAILTDAWLHGADLTNAELQRANLEAVILSDARLWETKLIQTDLRHASLDRSDLRNASLDGSDLQDASFQSADFDGAVFGAALAHGADFFDANGIIQDQLINVIGDNTTILPRDASTGDQLYVWSCWSEAPRGFSTMLKRYSRYDHDNLREKWLCAAGEEPEARGTPAELVERPAELKLPGE